MISGRTWWIIRVLWLATAAILLASVPDRLVSTILLLGAGFFLALAPRLVRQDSMLAEPLLSDGSERLLRAYAQRRKFRARAILAFAMVGVGINTFVAAAFGWHLEIDIVLTILAATIALLIGMMLLYGVRVRAVASRIQRLQKLADN